MFEGTPTQNQTGADANTAASGTDTQAAPLSTPHQVYTMPEKFMQPRAVSSSKTKKWLLIASICGVVVLVLIAIIVYAFQASTGTPVDTANQNTNDNALVNQNTNTTNVNRNSNVNNANGNTNTGGILNLNGAVDGNINSGLFPNGNSNANKNTNTSGSIGLPDRSDVSNGRDKDRDGLTDVEEDVYGTRFDLPDTDKDGYVDGTEVRNSFSPADVGKSLLEAGLVIAYAQPEYGWSIDYPADWIAEPVNTSKSEVMFSSDSVAGEFVEVLVTENTSHETAAEWYASLYEDVDPSELEAVTLGGLQGIVSPDGFTYYLADDTYLVGIVYNFGTKDEVQFRTTFEMMATSFGYTAVAPSAANVNTNTTTTNDNTNSFDITNTNNANTNNANSNLNSSANTNTNSNTNS